MLFFFLLSQTMYIAEHLLFFFLMFWLSSQYRWKVISQPFCIPSKILCMTDVVDPLCGPTKSSSVRTWFTFSSVSSALKYSGPHTKCKSQAELTSGSCVKGTLVNGQLVHDCGERNHDWEHGAVEKGTHHGMTRAMTNLSTRTVIPYYYNKDSGLCHQREVWAIFKQIYFELEIGHIPSPTL